MRKQRQKTEMKKIFFVELAKEKWSPKRNICLSNYVDSIFGPQMKIITLEEDGQRSSKVK